MKRSLDFLMALALLLLLGIPLLLVGLVILLHVTDWLVQLVAPPRTMPEGNLTVGSLEREACKDASICAGLQVDR